VQHDPEMSPITIRSRRRVHGTASGKSSTKLRTILRSALTGRVDNLITLGFLRR
jgi:hypothetical protein